MRAVQKQNEAFSSNGHTVASEIFRSTGWILWIINSFICTYQFSTLSRYIYSAVNNELFFFSGWRLIFKGIKLNLIFAFLNFHFVILIFLTFISENLSIIPSLLNYFFYKSLNWKPQNVIHLLLLSNYYLPSTTTNDRSCFFFVAICGKPQQFSKYIV